MNDSLMIGKILTISLKENTVFVKLFETSFASDMLAYLLILIVNTQILFFIYLSSNF